MSVVGGSLLVDFFPFLEPEYQIDDEPDKRNRGHNPPQCFFADGAEILLGHIDNGPDGGDKKRHT